jgi:glycosyltransferase involved in cell wall biosynthesis
VRTSERGALYCARHTITVSAANQRLLVAEYDVAPDRISVVIPGTDRVAAPQRAQRDVVALLSIGAIIPRKGHDVLIRALAQLTDLAWRLTIVGDATRHAEAAAHLSNDIDRFGLRERVTLAGAVTADKVPEFYAAADLFVLASRFEGYGMAFAEAIAHGLPVVGTSASAIPETVPDRAGVLVPPDDVDALAAALRRLTVDRTHRERLAAGARAAAAQFPTWRQTGENFAHVLAGLA